MIQTLKLSSLEENIVYQCFLVAPSSEVTFLARESCVIRNGSASRCLLSFEASKQLPASLEKKMSGSIWRKFVIQKLKLSALDENIVYPCFLAALFLEVTFLARQSCFTWNELASRCLMPFEASKQLLQLPLQVKPGSHYNTSKRMSRKQRRTQPNEVKRMT